MAYFGKEFVFAKEENYDAFIKSFGLDEEHHHQLLDWKPSEKIEKEGDGYKLTFDGGKKVVTFKNGVTFDEDVLMNATSKSTFTVDGNTITQTQVFGDLKITYKREYDGNTLKLTASSTDFDGVAYRWFNAA